MSFFTTAVSTMSTLVVALGGGVGVWGVVNLMEGYGADNPASKSQGVKQLMACLLYTSNVLIEVAQGLATVAGGVLAELSYFWCYAACVVIAVLALLPVLWMAEPPQ